MVIVNGKIQTLNVNFPIFIRTWLGLLSIRDSQNNFILIKLKSLAMWVGWHNTLNPST